jgi:hypothetical protein
MKTFLVIVRRAGVSAESLTHIAESSGRAAEDVAGMFDEPCGITVIAEVR